MSSSECLVMKNKYESVKSQVQNALAYFDGCSSSILDASSVLKELIIDGKSFDEDKLIEANKELSDLKGNLQAIIDECSEKINYYQSLYVQALNRECTAMAMNDVDDDGTSINKTAN